MKCLLMTSQVAGIGDVLFASPVLRALRTSFPDAAIDFFTSGAARTAAEAYQECFDKLYIYGPSSRQKLLVAWGRSRYDLVICLSEALSSILLALGARGARTYGFNWNGRGSLLTGSIRYPKPERMHILEAQRLLLIKAGLPEPSPEMWFPVGDESRKAAQSWMALHAPACGDGGFVAIHPGSAEAVKRWPEPRYLQIGLGLAEQERIPVLFVGGPSESGFAKRIPSHPLIGNAIGHLSLAETAACLEDCRLFLGNDGGILHLAAALRKPMVALYRSANFRKAAPLYEDALVLRAFRDRRPSPAIADIPVEKVWTCVLERLRQVA